MDERSETGGLTKIPENWSWRRRAVAAGPIVLVDVDGVIADNTHRQHFLRNGRLDFDGFFRAASADVPIEGAQALLASFGASNLVVLLTARPGYLHEITLDFLDEYAFEWDLLVMRSKADANVSSADFKRRSVRELLGYGFVPQLAIDDDPRNVAMFRAAGISSYYVHSGYYDHLQLG